jgi:broad specificity phosphatase PhoE
MTRLWLVRHGQTDWNVQGRWQGQAPDAPPMNAAGVDQVEALSEHLDGVRFTALYCSDLLRARQTADILARRTGLAVVPDARLREIALGEWEGMLGAEIEQRYPLELAQRLVDPVRSRPPSGETVEEMAVRLREALDDIAGRHPDDEVLIITHGLAMATVLCLASALPLERVFDHLPDNAQPTLLTWPLS